MNKIIYYGFVSIIRILFTHSILLSFGKEKNNQFDWDLRPIIIAMSILRLVDKVSFKILEPESQSLVGNYQLMGKKQALEKGKVITSLAQLIQKSDEKLAVLNVDAANAYNSMSRNKVYEILARKDKRMANYFTFLYSDDNIIQYDCQTIIKMYSGFFHGLTSSLVFYGTGKHEVFDNTIERCIIETNGKFKVYMEEDYVDDGEIMMEYQYIELFLNILIEEYHKFGIKINLEKSLIAMDTNNVSIQNTIIDL
jgi:hypothetical protein